MSRSPSPQAVVRAAALVDAGPVAAIFAHYVATSVATFEEVAPTAADWRQRLDDLAARSLPFLVAEAEGAVCGFAYASPWRPKPAYRHTVEDTVYLSPGHTGRGIGSALLRRRADWEQVTAPTRDGAARCIAVIADSRQRRVGGTAPPVSAGARQRVPACPASGRKYWPTGTRHRT